MSDPTPERPLPARVRLPISIRLTLWYGLSLLVLVGLFVAVLVTAVHVNRHVVTHQRLFRAQAELLPHVVPAPGGAAFEPALETLGRAYRQEEPFGLFVRLLSPAGAVLAASPNYDGRTGFAPRLPVEGRIAERDVRWAYGPLRVMYAPVRAADGSVAAWLEVSCPAFEMHHPFGGGPLVLAIGLTVVLALAGGYVLARRALRPVAALTAAANRIRTTDLSVRLPAAARFRDELTDLAETLNAMLARLDAGFARERRFTADAAHELLNPLAALRNEAEVTLRRPRDVPEYEQALHTVRAEAERMGRMVEHLLQLSRVEAGTTARAATPSDLAARAAGRVARLRPDAARKNVRLDARLDAPVHVTADTIHLDAVLDNLLDNALKYTPSGGTVTVSARAEGDAAVLEVADTGAGFAPEAAGRLFDRFYRADAPEVQAQAGSGLGLALVRAVVEACGGTVAARSDGPGRGSTFTVRLPLAPPGTS